MKQVEKFRLFPVVHADLGQRGHGVAANLFDRIAEQRSQPFSRLLLLRRRSGFRKDHPHGSHDGDGFESFPLGSAIKSGDFSSPKLITAQPAQALILLFGGVLLFHKTFRRSATRRMRKIKRLAGE